MWVLTVTAVPPGPTESTTPEIDGGAASAGVLPPYVVVLEL